MPTITLPAPVAVDGWDSPAMAASRFSGAFSWNPEQIPAGWQGSAHIGNGVWASRCSCHGDYFLTYGTVPRYAAPVGKHEAAHGMQVAGINVGMLP